MLAMQTHSIVAHGFKGRLAKTRAQRSYRPLGAADAFSSVVPGSSSEKGARTIQKRPISNP